MGGTRPGTREGSAALVKPEIKRPSMYRVLMHNDNYTTMDFVVFMLEEIFNKRRSEATRIMMQIHKNGIGVCGVYTAEVAETKIAIVHKHAQEYGFPLKCSMEPE